MSQCCQSCHKVGHSRPVFNIDSKCPKVFKTFFELNKAIMVFLGFRGNDFRKDEHGDMNWEKGNENPLWKRHRIYR